MEWNSTAAIEQKLILRHFAISILTEHTFIMFDVTAVRTVIENALELTSFYSNR